MNPPPGEEGMALLSVLLLIAVISAVTIGVLDDIRFSLRRTANAQSIGQAQWFALGAETLAKSKIRQLLDRDRSRLTLQGGWDGAPAAFPIEGGQIVARISDRGACFNLNSVVIGPADAPITNTAGIVQFAGLLEALDMPPGQALRLSAALADWIDADDSAGRLGAEDDAYRRRRPAYRTGGTLMAEVSELRAVSGFSPDIYGKVRPYVCALPRTGPSEININTLAPERAAVLSALYQGRLPVDAARRAIAARPAAGWINESQFLSQPALAAAEPGSEPPLQQLALRSRYFALDAQVDYAGAEVTLNTLLEQHPSGAIRTVARRWSPEE
jgi:general secretion pathway protein K